LDNGSGRRAEGKALCDPGIEATAHLDAYCIYIVGIISNEFASVTKEFPQWPVQQLRWPFSNAWRSAAAFPPQPKTSACRQPPWQSSSRDWSNVSACASSIGPRGTWH